MKKALLVLLAYVLALTQLGASVCFPDLLVLLVITAAVFEERNFALVVGLVSGLFLDCGNPSRLGSYMTIYLLVAYGVTLVRRLVYERTVYLLLFCVAALVLKLALGLVLNQVLPVWWQVLVSSLLTVALLVPAYRLTKLVFGYQWKVA